MKNPFDNYFRFSNDSTTPGIYAGNRTRSPAAIYLVIFIVLGLFVIIEELIG
jgi:hypothetical protein